MHLHSSLQFDLLLLLLVELHDLDLVLLEYSALLDVELLLGLRIDLFGFLAGLLLDEGHHVLDLNLPANSSIPDRDTHQHSRIGTAYSQVRNGLRLMAGRMTGIETHHHRRARTERNTPIRMRAKLSAFRVRHKPR